MQYVLVLMGFSSGGGGVSLLVGGAAVAAQKLPLEISQYGQQ